MELKVKKGTYEPEEGCVEPCIIVTNGWCEIRIAKCYHYFGGNTLFVTEFHNGEFNSQQEINGDFNTLTKQEALRIAKSCSAYI